MRPAAKAPRDVHAGRAGPEKRPQHIIFPPSAGLLQRRPAAMAADGATFASRPRRAPCIVGSFEFPGQNCLAFLALATTSLSLSRVVSARCVGTAPAAEETTANEVVASICCTYALAARACARLSGRARASVLDSAEASEDGVHVRPERVAIASACDRRRGCPAPTLYNLPPTAHTHTHTHTHALTLTLCGCLLWRGWCCELPLQCDSING